MAFNAGEVYVLLGGKFAPTAFNQFGRAAFKAKADMERAERGINQSNDRMAKGAKIAAMGIAGIAVGGTALFIKGAIGAGKVAASFEQELKKLAARSDITERQLKKVRQAALDQGTAMGVGATMAAKASTELIKGGVSVQKLLSGGLKGALALAVAGEMDVAQAAETVANALNQFNLAGSQSEHVADALATAANATTADVADMAIALTQGGAAAKAAGLSFDETVGFLEALASSGVKGSDAGTSMKTALVQLANPTKEAAGLMEKLGIDLFDVQGNIKPLPQLAGIFQDKLKGLTKEQRLQAATTLAGTDGMRALLALYDAGPKKVDGWIKGLKVQGTAAKVAAEQNEGAAGAAKRLKATWEQAQIIVGSELLPAIADGADTLSKKLQEMADDGTLKEMGQDMADLATAASENIPAALEAISGFVDKMGGAGDAVSTLGDLVSAAQTLGEFMISPGSLFSGGLWDGFLQGARAAVVAVKATFIAMDAIPGVDMSGPLRKVKTALAEIDAARDKIANTDLQITFSADQGSLDEVYKIADKLEGLGKRKAAIEITANSRSAQEAIEGMKAVLAGVPLRRVIELQTLSHTAEEAIWAFRAVAAGVPAKKVLAIQAQSRTASVAVVAFRALVAGVPASKITKILAETNSARGQLSGIIGLIAGIQSKTVTITTNRVENLIQNIIKNPGASQLKPRKGKAVGRGPAGREAALIGEGGGPEWRINPETGMAYRTEGPEFVDLDAKDYVIPTEPKYRSGALGLMKMLARDLGIEMFGGGTAPKASASQNPPKPKPKAAPKKPPKKARYIPPKLEPTAYNVGDFEDKEAAAKGAIDKSKQIRKNLANAKTQLRRAERMPTKTAKQKAARKDSVDQAQRRIDGYEKDLKGLPQAGNLTRLRALWAERKKELRDAKTFQAKIDLETKRANNARDAMALADKRDDGPGYEKARKDQAAALTNLQKWLQGARDLSVKAGNVDRAADLEGTLTGIANDLIDNAAAEQDEPDETPAQKAAREASERLADTGMTDAERARLSDIEKDAALAGLTQTLDDDKAAAGAKVSFLQGILDAALGDPARGGSDTIAELATSLKTARDNVTSFSGGTANENADLQAQIDQGNERTRVAEANSKISEAALAAFQGFAAAGPGGLGGTTVNINTLHPGDPKVWSAVAQTANAGNDLGLTRRPNTVRVGP
jgi:TP901 family phage tail tape measure protein